MMRTQVVHLHLFLPFSAPYHVGVNYVNLIKHVNSGKGTPLIPNRVFGYH
ncbi:predicted protein [Arabidopsis lyrata subsp. lyrata]|uniref:Predicted protein n=1 Tax=Arabidopsis lyrata subsp. lyrata TaxID=81972 RepID=D7LN18_ARALL|nr:predicted protein [Arabidopsis lyrata subsp. lyrata]